MNKSLRGLQGQAGVQGQTGIQGQAGARTGTLTIMSGNAHNAFTNVPRNANAATNAPMFNVVNRSVGPFNYAYTEKWIYHTVTGWHCVGGAPTTFIGQVIEWFRKLIPNP
jgi:hypothetical protein